MFIIKYFEHQNIYNQIKKIQTGFKRTIKSSFYQLLKLYLSFYYHINVYIYSDAFLKITINISLVFFSHIYLLIVK